MPTAPVKIPIVNCHDAANRHVPPVIAPIQPFPIACFWHGQPPCEMHHEKIGRAAIGGHATAPIKINVGHHA
jgi:hypothetical protein